MGQSSSTEHISPEQKEAESLAASNGALTMLQQAFSHLSDPQTNSIPLNSLKQCFSLHIESPTCESTATPAEFSGLLENVDSSIVDTFFSVEEEGISWIEFLRGYIKCCGRQSSSNSFNALFRLFASASLKAGFPEKVHLESDNPDSKMNGSILPVGLLMLLWFCWIMSKDSRISSHGKEANDLPDVNHLILSAIEFCTDSATSVVEIDILGSDLQLPVVKVHMWALKTVPNLPDCLSDFFHARLRKSVTPEEKLEPSCSSVTDTPTTTTSMGHNRLLTRGRAWAISLALRSSTSEEVLNLCFDEDNDNIIYRSSLNGKGMNRFWSNVEGYKGPLLILVAASSVDNNDKEAKKWIIGVLTDQGVENKDAFYGTSANLFAIDPVFHIFSSSGKEKNCVYTHLHKAGRYDAHPKPVGIGFGGSTGNERVFIDDDFNKIIVRHHAVDKTFEHGSLFPDQGFLPVEASLMEIEVWGLGGHKAKDVQNKFKKREELFTAQRRKVDLKTFGNWEDSPEKMMMAMMSNPNAVRRREDPRRDDPPR
jgi:hypothetical protein